MATFNSASYVKPVVNGSSGQWGNLLNSVIDQVDTDFTAIDTRIDTLEAVTHVTTFSGLTDTPSSLSGQAGKILKVNSSGNAVEFVTDTIPVNVQDLSNVTVSSPSTGQVLKWDGSAWTNQADASGGGGISLSEARQALSVGSNASASGDGSIGYDNSTGVFTFTPPSISGSYATLSSPSFSGTPTAPTAGSSTNTTQIATTAFVQSALIKTYTSSWTNFNSSLGGTTSTFTHGLGGQPDIVNFNFKCTTAEHGYSVGDIIMNSDMAFEDSGVPISYIDGGSTTQIKVQAGYNQRFGLSNKTTGVVTRATAGRWQFRIQCIKF